MKKKFIPALLVGLAILTATAAKKNDPVLMTVNGKDVHQSEFEYLYNKNNRQQMQPQGIDEYVDMFVTYKLKVADAEAAGIDTTAAFRKEFEGYCSELARPYMRDSLVEERLVQEAYARMDRMVDVSHIMMPIGTTHQERIDNKARLDSIRTAVLNGADFAEMAKKFSSDRSAVRNGGRMGYIYANMYPYPFELAAFSTPVGQVSEVIDDAPYGYHIVKVNGEKPNPGSVHARHILKLTRDMTPEQAQAKKAEIDSIYNILASGNADFESIARAESDDPGSARNGGDLGFFGMGRMVPEFEEVAFSLNDGEISKPFASPFGYHIVQVIEHKGIGSLEEERPQILKAIGRDVRANYPETERLNQLKKDYHAVILPQGLDKVKTLLSSAADTESGFALLDTDKTVVATIGDRKFTAADVMASMKPNVRQSAGDGYTTFYDAVGQILNDRTLDYARERLIVDQPDYRNLVNEYRDGILLFEISNRNVWDRSTRDTEGLEEFFRVNRDNYKWDAPKYKGYIVFATNDSVAGAARRYLASHEIEKDSLVKTLRKEFGRTVKIERVIAAKGDNAIVDNVAFNGEQAAAPGNWKAWFGYKGRIIDAPEEAADVRGAVSADFQQELERRWIESLHKKYPVKINKKAIKKLKK
ncbi:MAG: peptidylprolyl isomerase [Duncaniella sp.]|nr:peptidylprolyl isomerase [Duncaniella sp.]